MARFQKGHSGNPNGRPLAARGLRAALFARYGHDGAMLVERLEALSKLTDGRNARIALAATELLLAYHSGKPTQLTEISGPGGTSLTDIQAMSTEELRTHVLDLLGRWTGGASRPGIGNRYASNDGDPN